MLCNKCNNNSNKNLGKAKVIIDTYENQDIPINISLKFSNNSIHTYDIVNKGTNYRKNHLITINYNHPQSTKHTGQCAIISKIKFTEPKITDIDYTLESQNIQASYKTPSGTYYGENHGNNFINSDTDGCSHISGNTYITGNTNTNLSNSTIKLVRKGGTELIITDYEHIKFGTVQLLEH